MYIRMYVKLTQETCYGERTKFVIYYISSSAAELFILFKVNTNVAKIYSSILK